VLKIIIVKILLFLFAHLNVILVETKYINWNRPVHTGHPALAEQDRPLVRVHLDPVGEHQSVDEHAHVARAELVLQDPIID
jgi:hypothetical protein